MYYIAFTSLYVKKDKQPSYKKWGILIFNLYFFLNFS
jgi:hypothetical protein